MQNFNIKDKFIIKILEKTLNGQHKAIGYLSPAKLPLLPIFLTDRPILQGYYFNTSIILD
ncbi:hypothetical protein SAMN05216490_1574 [Mucilaginibacter mallensis]|uniref:Uncharacterized protein n=1 Tax=Mucilaginibacter mallensis TaxID=652787 RepID=A0A1H1U3V9_MUCMA|nr:hypothetical protein SAMN05216490_1574 [Mucilaginibacter mallensis]